MTNISASSLTGPVSKTWQLQAVKAELYDSEGNEILKTFTDFSNQQFLEEFGGYAMFQITFFENRNFEAVYKTAEGTIAAEGRWNLDDQNIILEQSTGDEILLTTPKINGKTLEAGYEFLMFNHGIQQLSFAEV